jgi:16S rRNA (cytosine1402-N4)-methyltransferase
MKYGPDEPGPTAADIVNTAPEEELRDLFFRYGERHARRIARKIVERRAVSPIETTGQLGELMAKAAPHKPGRHPGTLVFLALRAAVNQEIEAIQSAVPAALGLLRSGGRLVVITYQSEEDRVVKDLLRRAARGCACSLPADECVCNNPPDARLVNKKVITPSPEEILENARARSAKMRVAEKIGSRVPGLGSRGKN